MLKFAHFTSKKTQRSLLLPTYQPSSIPSMKEPSLSSPPPLRAGLKPHTTYHIPHTTYHIARYKKHWICWRVRTWKNTLAPIFFFKERKENRRRKKCHMSGVMCNMPHVAFHMSLTPTATATYPAPANFPTIHSRMVHKDQEITFFCAAILDWNKIKILRPMSFYNFSKGIFL